VKAHALRLPDLDESFVVPRTDSINRLDTIRRIVHEHKIERVYAQADKEVAWLAANRASLPAVALPSDDALSMASDKLVLNRTLSRVTNVPESYGYDDDFETEFDYLRYLADRVWVRARCGAGSKAALPVKTACEARFWVNYWCNNRGLKPSDFMLCEFLPGDEFAHQSVWNNGNLIASVTRQRLEYVFAEQMPSGQSSTPSHAVIVHRRDVNDSAERAVHKIDPNPHGVYGVDMKCNAGGVPCVTEINVGRFYTTSDFYAAAGCNLPALLMRGGSDVVGRDPIPAGREWIRSLDREAVLV
jgi:predicted ATP-grasp superfamily ATP-dependent carboligase